MTGRDTEDSELALILLAEYWELAQKTGQQVTGQQVLVVGAARHSKSSLVLLEIAELVALGFEDSLEHHFHHQTDHRSFPCSSILWACLVSACSRMLCCLEPLQIVAY
jgi:hypothetical protein